jgi:hypothetical protein
VTRTSLDVGTLRAALPGWVIFHNGEAWFAIRRGGGMERYGGPGTLLPNCLRAESVEDLAQQLCLQDYLDRCTNTSWPRCTPAGNPRRLFRVMEGQP